MGFLYFYFLYTIVGLPGKWRCRIWVAGKPDDRKFYWIAVGEGYRKNEVTHFNFHVYPDSTRILFYDIINEREMPLEKWRERK
jgi:hypothetical protein